MSKASKITLTLAMMISAGVVGYVHYRQTLDREKLHEGVLRDVLRQEKRKIENTYVLQQQIDKGKQLKQAELNNKEKAEIIENAQQQNKNTDKVFDGTAKPQVSKNDAEDKYHQVFETSQDSKAASESVFITAPTTKSKDEV